MALNIQVLSDNRLYPTVFNVVQGSNAIDTVVYTLENYIVGERDLSTYNWYVHLIGVEGVDAVKLTSAIVDNKLQVTFDLTEYVTRLGDTLTYQLVAKDDTSAVWNSAKGVILNAESINADDKIVANYASILRQWELRIEEMAGSLDTAIYYIPYNETLPKEDRMTGRLYYQYLYAENLNGQLEDSNGNILIPEQVAKNIGISEIDGLTASDVQTALQALKVMIENKDSLPVQAGNAGKYLKTDGEKASWDEVEALPDQTDNAGKYLTTDGEKATWVDVPRGMPLLSSIWTDHKLNDVSYLRADTFSWQSGDVYKAAYNHLVADFEGTVAETETIGDTTITFYRADDGHKICLPDQEANLMALYEATGVAWYYLLDTANKQFKLPRTKFGFTGLRDSVGGYIEPGIPNITGTFTRNAFNSTVGRANEVSGVFTSTSSNGGHSGGGGTGNSYGTVTLDASVGSDIYGNGDTVQPPATQMYLYFYVGNYVRDLDEVNIGAWSEMINSGDAQVMVDEINTVKEAALAEIESAGEATANFQQPLITLSQTSGTASLEINKIYSMAISGDLTFVLPASVNTNYFNQIKVMAMITGTPTITWGTSYFVNKEAPTIKAGYYDIYFDWDNNLGGWVVGTVIKG